MNGMTYSEVKTGKGWLPRRVVRETLWLKPEEGIFLRGSQLLREAGEEHFRKNNSEYKGLGMRRGLGC